MKPLLFAVGILFLGCSKGRELPQKIEATEKHRLKGFHTLIQNFHPVGASQLLAQTTERETVDSAFELRFGIFDVAQGWDVALSTVFESKDEVRPRVAAFSNPVGTRMVLAREVPVLRDAKEPPVEGGGLISYHRTRLKFEWYDFKTRAVDRTDWEGEVEGRMGAPALRTVQLRLSSDLSYLALVTQVDGSVHLMKFGSDGRRIYATRLCGASAFRFYNWPFVILAEGESDGAVVLFQLFENDRAAFEAQYNTKLPPSRRNALYVLMRLDGSGKTATVLPLTEGENVVPSDVLARGRRIVVLGEDQFSFERSRLHVSHFSLNETGTTLTREGGQPFAISKKQDRVTSALLLSDGRILVGGEAGYKQVKTGSVVEGSEAFLLLLNAQANDILGFTKFGDRRRRNLIEGVRAAPDGSLVATATLDAPLTHDTDGGKRDQGYTHSAFFDVKISQ